MRSTQAVGFYNSDRNAGASQRHKHMQLLPLDIVLSARRSSSSAAAAATDSESNTNAETLSTTGNHASNTNIYYEDIPVDVLIAPKIYRSHWIPYDPFQLG